MCGNMLIEHNFIFGWHCLEDRCTSISLWDLDSLWMQAAEQHLDFCEPVYFNLRDFLSVSLRLWELLFLHRGSLNVAGSCTFASSNRGEICSIAAFLGAPISVLAKPDEVGGMSLFLQVAAPPPHPPLGSLYLYIVTGQPYGEDLCLMRFLLCLGALRALLSSSGGLITAFLCRRTFFSPIHTSSKFKPIWSVSTALMSWSEGKKFGDGERWRPAVSHSASQVLIAAERRIRSEWHMHCFIK